MTDLLPACPFCGTAPYTNVNGDPTGFGATIECIAGKCSVNPRVHADAPTLSRAEEWAAKRWRARSLSPALDVVLEFAENKDNMLWHIMRQIRHQETLQNPLMDANAFEHHRFLATLRALREHSPTDSEGSDHG